MARYHISPTTGRPNKCKAMVSCPFGDLDKEHYSSPEEARQAYEKSMANMAIPSTTVKNPDVTTSIENLRSEKDRARMEELLGQLGNEAIESAEKIYNTQLPPLIRQASAYDGEFKLKFKCNVMFDGSTSKLTPELIADVEFAKDATHDPFELAKQLIVREFVAQIISKKD